MKNESFDELIAGIKEARKINRGEAAASRLYEFPEPDIKAIRVGIGYAQSKFATLIGVNIRPLQNWEQADPLPVVKNLHVNHA